MPLRLHGKYCSMSFFFSLVSLEGGLETISVRVPCVMSAVCCIAIEFVQTRHNKAISRDTWNQLWDFTKVLFDSV